MLGCKPADIPIEQIQCCRRHDDRWGIFHSLVARLIYLSHTRPNIACTMNVASQFMHSPKEVHFEVIHRIL